MAPLRRKLDRAQRDRARRQWWIRHGAFASGMLTSVALGIIVGLLTKF
jgi:hypothetical protein